MFSELFPDESTASEFLATSDYFSTKMSFLVSAFISLFLDKPRSTPDYELF